MGSRSRRGKTFVAVAFACFLTPAASVAQAPVAPSGGQPALPAVGDVVPAFEAQGIDGAVRRLGYGKGSTTLVLFFSSGCAVCHRMIPLWNDAHARKAPGIEVIGVLVDQEPPGFFTLTPVSFPVVRSPGRALMNAYKVARVPVTLRIVEGGRIDDVAVGPVDPIRLGELFRPPPAPARK